MRIVYCSLLLLLGCLYFPTALTGQEDSCYRSLVDEGMTLYGDQRFEEAINRLKAARGCWDKPRNDQLAEMIEKVNDGYRSFLEVERNKALAAQQQAETAREAAEKANEALTVQLAISEANSLAFLSSLESEKNNHDDALILAFAAYQRADTLPIVLRSFGEVLLRARSVTLPVGQGSVGQVAFSPQAEQVVTAAGPPEYDLQIWNADGQLLKSLQAHTNAVSALSIHPAGAPILSASYDHTVKLWTKQGELLATIEEHSAPVTVAAFAPNGEYFVSGDLDGNLFIGDIRGAKIAMQKGHQKKISGLAFSSDGQVFISVSADGAGKLWRRSGEQVATFEGHQAPIWAVKFSADERSVLTYAADRSVRVWDLSGKEIRHYLSDGMIKYAFWGGQDEQVLTVSSDGWLHAWGKDGEAQATTRAHEQSVSSIDVNPTTGRFITTGADRSLRVWDMDFQPLQTFIHSEAVLGGRFSPTYESILTYSADGTAKLWDLAGNILLNWRPTAGKVDRVAFSPDGSRIFLSSDAGKAILAWHPLHFLEYLKAHPPPPLSEEKKSLYGLK